MARRNSEFQTIRSEGGLLPADLLRRVLDRQLEGREYIVGEYSIADMAIYPWAAGYSRLELDIAPFPNVTAWLARVAARPATIRAYEKGDAAIDAFVKG